MANEKRLIEKQEAIKLLRGKCVGKYPSTFYVGIFAAADEIAKLPEVDAVEVVRCKDCKQWIRNSGIAESPNGHCFCHDIVTNGHDFCSYGERRTDV